MSESSPVTADEPVPAGAADGPDQEAADQESGADEPATPALPPPPDLTAAAFFDVDNTLVHGSSLVHFARGLAARDYFKYSDLARFAYAQAKFQVTGKENSDDVAAGRRKALSFIEGRQTAELEALGDEIYDEIIADKIWEGTRALTQMHLDAGQQVWLVTATPMELAQTIADRLAFARDATIGTVDWNGDLSCAGGTSSDFDITVGAINAIVTVTSGGTYHVHASAGATVTEAAIEGGGSLAADAWYYLYAYRSGGGSLAYELSTTAPGPSRRFKTGDTTRRYLGCVRTTAAGAPLAFEASRGQYRFRRSAIGSPDVTLRRLTRTSVGSATLDLVPRVPPHARCVDVRCTVALGAATSAALSVSTASTDAGYAEVLDGVAGGLARLSARLPVHHATVADASIFYDFSHDNVSDSTTSAKLIVDGWVE